MKTLSRTVPGRGPAREELLTREATADLKARVAEGLRKTFEAKFED